MRRSSRLRKSPERFDPSPRTSRRAASAPVPASMHPPGPLRAARPAPAPTSDFWQPTTPTSFVRKTLGPAALLFVCPLAVHVFALCVKSERWGGSIVDMLVFGDDFPSVAELFPAPTWPAGRFLLVLVAVQLVLYVAVPGTPFDGPRSPTGHVPRYRDNGLLCFCLTCVTAAVLSSSWPGLFPPTLIYDELMPLLTLLNASALLLSTVLYAKGLLAPSTRDCGSSGNLFIDIYWGTELYPSVLNLDLKQFVICRLGIVLWFLFFVSFGMKQREMTGTGAMNNAQFVSVALQAVYITKFFYWERWYLHAADIQVDRFGFMLCWGTLCFMPVVHTLQNLFMVRYGHGEDMSDAATAAYLIIGNTCTFLNYDSDTQRHRVRASRGKCRVWGAPATFIEATYTTADGKEHRALLSTCGWQGLVRHFHYLPDIMNLVLYCSPAGFTRVLPHMYFLYLTALLLDRTTRIDQRCASKYGRFWEEYCRLVPYKLIPGVW